MPILSSSNWPLWASCPQLIYRALYFIVWNIPLASSGQLSWLCSFLTSSAAPCSQSMGNWKGRWLSINTTSSVVSTNKSHCSSSCGLLFQGTKQPNVWSLRGGKGLNKFTFSEFLWIPMSSIIPMFSLGLLLLLTYLKNPSCYLTQHQPVSGLVEIWSLVFFPCIWEWGLSALPMKSDLASGDHKISFSLQVPKGVPCWTNWVFGLLLLDLWHKGISISLCLKFKIFSFAFKWYFFKTEQY